MNDVPQPIGKTKHGELDLNQIASLMPGLGMLMPEISRRYAVMWHAARGGNWALAHYQLRQVRHLMTMGATTRPKHAKNLEAFLDGTLAPIEEAIPAQDWAKFDALFQKSIAVVNHFHQISNHPEVRWQLDPEPPHDLDLTAGKT